MPTTKEIQELTRNMEINSQKMPLIYVSGPFRALTGWQIEKNIRTAEEYALRLWKSGAAVICPHINTRFYQGELPDNTWLAGDLVILRSCDAIFMLPEWKTSEGATVELEYAKKLEKKILYGLYFAKNYIKGYIQEKSS